MMNKSIAFVLVGIAAISSGMTYAMLQSANEPTLRTEGGGISGHLVAVLYDENGNIKAYRQTDNRIVDRGLDVMADLVFNGMNLVTGEATVKAMGIGVGTTASATTQTDLVSRTGVTACTNGTATFTEGATTAGQVNATATVSFTGASCDGAITEAGLFTAAAGVPTGHLFARQSFSAINTGAADTLQITWSTSLADDGNE